MITLDIANLERIQARVAHVREKVPGAMSRALNRSLENARTNAVRKTTEGYNIKASDVRSTIRLSKSSAGNLNAIIRSRSTRRELIKFKVSPNRPRPKNPPAVLRVAVKKEGLKPLPGAFVAAGKSSGKLHVLKRSGKSRYPIHIKYGPSVPEMIGQPNIRAYIETEAKITFERRIDHEVNRLLGGRA